MPRSGTLVICVQNLDFSGANQVVLNIVMGRMHESNVVVLSPKIGTFAARFVESGAAVRVGVLQDLLNEIRDVFCIICNTIMTADIVVEMSDRPHPVIWILHEWWDDDMIRENLRIRNYQGLTLSTVKLALAKADRVVCVCESQRRLYNPSAPSTVIFVGVPDPVPRQQAISSSETHAVPASIAVASSDHGSQEFLPLGVHCCIASTSSPSCASLCTTSMVPTTTAIPVPPSSISETQLTPSISIKGNPMKPFTFLCLGIICPRKNQLWTIQLFKKFCCNKSFNSVRLQIVGARYTRVYEIEYLQRVKEEIATSSDGRDYSSMIEVYDVTDDVEHFYRNADCLILTSLNEVTPMVISESFSWSLPVISTNIAGIKEMYINGIEGYHFNPNDEQSALYAMETIYSNPILREQMSLSARKRFECYFDINHMIEEYRRLVLQVAPPVILVDMDGAMINWDQGFYRIWKEKGYDKVSHIDRSKSYFMEKCIVSCCSNTMSHPFGEKEAEEIFLSKGFFEGLEAMEGAIQAIHEMDQCGFKVYICTAPILHSQYCAQEKLNWIRKHLGESWLHRVILCADKTMVAGDLLIDDKPYEYLSPGGKHTTATWKQIIFDAPYNRQKRLPRMFRWRDWKSYVYPMLGKECPAEIFALSLEEFDGACNHGPIATCPSVEHGAQFHNLPPKPPSLSIGKIRQALSTAAAIHSGKSVDEIQKDHDLLQPPSGAATPLNPEELATIVSGSVSLLGGEDGAGGSSEDERDEQHMSQKGEDEKKQILPPHIMKQKKKALNDRMRERNEQYKACKENAERHLALHHSDEVEGEGLQIFSKAYKNWASSTSERVSTPIGCSNNSSTPLSSKERDRATQYEKA